MPRLKIIVTGKVQGVCYRAFTAGHAERLGVSGTVRNLPDGSVEIIAQAAQHALDALLEQCRQGPPAAWVEQLYIDILPDGEAVTGFSVLR